MINLSRFYHPDGIVDVRGAVKAGRDPWVTGAKAVSDAAAKRSGHKATPSTTWYCPGAYQDPAGANAALGALVADCDAAFVTSLDGYLKDQAAPTAQNIVRAWTTVNKGVSTYKGTRGNDSFLAMCTEGNGLVHAAVLLDTQTHYGWSATDQANARAWVRDYYVPIAQNILGPQHMTNNWADWALYALALAAYYLPDAALRDWVESALRDHIVHAIDPHSSPPYLLPEEMARGEYAVNYEYFALMPMVSACLTLHACGGADLLSDGTTGPLVRGAIGTLLGMLSPLLAGMLPASNDAADLFELAGAIYGSAEFKAYAKPYRPVLTLGHHLSLGTPSTLSAVVLPPSVPQRRAAHRRATDAGPLDPVAPAVETPTTEPPQHEDEDEDEPEPKPGDEYDDVPEPVPEPITVPEPEPERVHDDS